MIASALMIAIMIITVAELYASTSVTDIQLSKDDFREEATQISSNFKGALAMAMTEVSKELERKSSVTLYRNYTTLDSYPDAKEKGAELMTNWYETILTEYGGRSLNLSISGLDFECIWNSSQAFSKASSTISLDILAYGFYGWNQNASAELTLNIMNLKESQSNVTFSISLQKENGLPVTDLLPSYITIYYLAQRGNSTWFEKADYSTIKIAYLGGGIYNVSFAQTGITTPPTIKMILRDTRGIIVASIPGAGVVLSENIDTIGPNATNLVANPNPCPKQSLTKLTAVIDDLASGANNIVAAEYFVDTTGPNGIGTPMSASDGFFSSLKESVEAQIDVSKWTSGNHTIYVHGEDAVRNWGNFSSLTLKVLDPSPAMHVASIDMRLNRNRRRSISCTATVTIVDSQGKPVAGAMVYGHWSGSVRGSVSAQTDRRGETTFTSDQVSYNGWGRLTFTFTVDNVVKSGWRYDQGSNVITSITKTYP